MTQAVVFDLWDTLVRFDPVTSRESTALVAARLGHDPDEFESVWAEGRPARDTGPMSTYLETLGATGDVVAEIRASRHDWARAALVPEPGVVETLVELRRRGLKTGLLSVCSDDVPAVWAETRLHGLFDAEVFSCDGANDELAGAERAGLRAILICPDGREPFWPEAREWAGARISAIPEVLELL